MQAPRLCPPPPSRVSHTCKKRRRMCVYVLHVLFCITGRKKGTEDVAAAANGCCCDDKGRNEATASTTAEAELQGFFLSPPSRQGLASRERGTLIKLHYNYRPRLADYQRREFQNSAPNFFMLSFVNNKTFSAFSLSESNSLLLFFSLSSPRSPR